MTAKTDATCNFKSCVDLENYIEKKYKVTNTVSEQVAIIIKNFAFYRGLKYNADWLFLNDLNLDALVTFCKLGGVSEEVTNRRILVEELQKEGSKLRWAQEEDFPVPFLKLHNGESHNNKLYYCYGRVLVLKNKLLLPFNCVNGCNDVKEFSDFLCKVVATLRVSTNSQLFGATFNGQENQRRCQGRA